MVVRVGEAAAAGGPWAVNVGDPGSILVTGIPEAVDVAQLNEPLEFHSESAYSSYMGHFFRGAGWK